MNAWTSGGPYGGRIEAALIDPSDPLDVLVASGSNGFFRSADGGATWVRTSDSTLGRADCLARAADGAIFAMESGFDPELVKSTDGGATWEEVAVSGLEDLLRSSALKADPASPSVLWLGTSDGPAVSQDGGASFTLANVGLEGVRVRSVAIDALSNPGTIYLGTDQGAYKSMDGGATWLTAGLVEERIEVVIADPTLSGRLYASSHSKDYLTTDGGDSWSVLRDWAPEVSSFRFFAVDPAHPEVLLSANESQLFRSEDLGATWVEADLGIAYEPRIEAVVIQGSRAMVAANDGPYSSTDGGATFTRSVQGLTNLIAGDILVDIESAAHVYYGTLWDTVFFSPDRGTNWAASEEGLGKRQLRGLAQSPSGPDRFATNTFDALYQSNDRGQSWTETVLDPNDFGYPGPRLTRLAYDPGDAEILYSTNLSEIFDSQGEEITTPGVLRSTDGGGRWTELYTTPQLGNVVTVLDLDQLIVVDSLPRRIYAAGYRNHDLQTTPLDAIVIRSDDDGETWDEVFFEPNAFAYRLTVDPTDPDRLYHAVFCLGEPEFYCLYRSEDAGNNWVRLSGADGICIQDLVVDPADPSRLYAVCDEIRVSTDYGENWEVLDKAGLPDDPNFLANAVAIDQGEYPKTLHVGTNWGHFSRALNEVDLSIEGTCPTELTTSVSGGTPGGQAVLLSSSRLGEFTLPGGPCAGTVMELLAPSLLAVANLDETGAFSFTRSVPSAACGLSLQAIDLDTCFVSSAILVDTMPE